MYRPPGIHRLLEIHGPLGIHRLPEVQLPGMHRLLEIHEPPRDRRVSWVRCGSGGTRRLPTNEPGL
jgi:hypothetical protein